MWSENKHGKGRSLLFDGAICATENKTGGVQRQSIKAVTGIWERVQAVMILDTVSEEPMLYLILSVFSEARHEVYTRTLHTCKI